MLSRYGFFVSVISILLVSCADVPEDQVAPMSPPTTAPVSNSQEPLTALEEMMPEENLKFVVVGQSEPNQYQVTLKWPSFEGSVRVALAGKVLDVIPGTEEGFVQSRVPGGKRLSYEVSFLKRGQSTLIQKSILIETPRDVVLSGNVELKDHQVLEAQRVFILKNTVIFTADKNLEIRAKEFISQGVIYNYSAEARASYGRAGRNGGIINITADKASGQLAVVLRGEAGGVGKSSARLQISDNSSIACPGSSGGNGGNAGSLHVNFKDGRGLSLTFENIPGASGKAGVRGGAHLADPQENMIRPPCDFFASNGVDGRPGNRGMVCLKMATENPVLCQ